MSQKKKKHLTKNPAQNKKVQVSDFLSNPRYQEALTVTAFLIPAVGIISFYYSLYKYSYNFPFFDDFDSILQFINNFIASTSIREKIRLLFEQHSEHRLVFDRAVALFEYYILGQINFKSFIIIGNGALLVTLIMLYKSFQLKQKFHLIFLVPIAFVIFNFRFHETSFWPMAAMQNLWVLCFALSSLYFLHAKEIKYSFYLSILFGWMATFTSANGMMTFLAGGFVLLINRELFSKKNLIWLVAGGIAMASYFYHYTKPGYHPEIIKPFLDHPLGFFGYAFAFLGGIFTEDATTAISIGVILVLCSLFLTYKKYYKENPVIYSFIIFILITSVLAALTRFGFGMDQSLSSKYTISSALLVASCYAALTSIFHKKIKILYLTILVGLAFYFQYTTNGKYLPAKKSEKEEFDKNYALVTQGKLSHFNFGWPQLDDRKELPRQLLRTADSLGYYKFKFKSEQEILKDIPADATKEIKFKLERFEQTQANALVMSGWAFIKNVNSDNVMTILCFKDTLGNPSKYFICQKYAHQDITQANASDNTNYNNSGFFTFFNPKEVKHGKYILEIIITDGNFKTELNTGQILNMQ